MHEYQLTFKGESDAAMADIIKNPESVRSEYIEFGKDDERLTGLAVYLTPANEELYRLGVLREYGVDFISGLSQESYYNRFITGKPNDRKGIEHTVDHFLNFDGRYHTTIAVLRENAMIAAVSAFEPKDEDLRGKHVVELSITVADEYHRKGLGRLLLQRVIAQAIDDDFTHVIANFAPGNSASRMLIEIILGSNNLVAGAHNLEEKFYRLGVTNPKEDGALEAMLRGIAGPGNTKVYPAPEIDPKYTEKLHPITFSSVFKSLIASVGVGSSHIPATEEQLTFDIMDNASQVRL